MVSKINSNCLDPISFDENSSHQTRTSHPQTWILGIPFFTHVRHQGLAPCPEVNKCRWSISLKKTGRQGEMIKLTNGLNLKTWTHRLKHSNKICSQDALSDSVRFGNESKLRIRRRLWKQPSLPWLSTWRYSRLQLSFCWAKWPHPKCQIAPSKKKNTCTLFYAGKTMS